MGRQKNVMRSTGRHDPGGRLKTALAATGMLVGVVFGLAGATGAGATPAPFGRAAEIGVGRWHACAVASSGALRCWGVNLGLLGDGKVAESSVPVGVVGISDATQVSGGETATCSVLDGGEVRCWGRNYYGGLGDGTTTDSEMPVAVVGITDATDVVVGVHHACALIDDGTIECWGRNSGGQLGDGTFTDSLLPVPVSGISTAVEISDGYNGACARLADGTVKCWGQNHYGQLGDGSTTSSSAPVTVTGLTGAKSITRGQQFACATTSESVWCWGRNNNGQLGDGTTSDSSVPVKVSELEAATRVTAGTSHACAQLADASARCWGANSAGQLGDGTTTGTTKPVPITGLPGVGDMAAGGLQTCANDLASGTLHCWGQNTNGQLGDGTTVDRSTPTPVIGGLCESAPDPGFNDVSASAYYADAVAWLAAMGISTGTGPNTYSPNAVVSRKDMAVFLWRAFDSPEPDGANPFSDVPDGAYYTDATTWLAEAGISTGTSPGMFSPNATVTRRDMAVFLWRATNSLDAPPHSFGDVPGGVYYEDAVSWLAHVGISVGTAPGVYSPNANVTRKDMAVFLNRRGCGTT